MNRLNDKKRTAVFNKYKWILIALMLSLYALFLLVWCGRTIKVNGFSLKDLVQTARPGQQIARESRCTPPISHGEGEDCVLTLWLAWGNPYNELGLVAINSQDQAPVTILQLDQQGGPSDHATHTSYRRVGNGEKGSAMECTAPFERYGDFQGCITYQAVLLSEPSLQRLFCADCQAAIEQLEAGSDILLVDYVGQRYYDLCGADYSFVIRERYEVNTRHKEDGTVEVHIWDKQIYGNE